MESFGAMFMIGLDGTASMLRSSLSGKPGGPYRGAEEVTEAARPVLDSLGDDPQITHYVPHDSQYLHISLPPFTAILDTNGQEPGQRYGFKVANTPIVPHSEPWHWFPTAAGAAEGLLEWFVGFDFLEWYAPVLAPLADLNLSPVVDGTACRLEFDECTATVRLRQKGQQCTLTPKPGAPLRAPMFTLEIRDNHGSHLLRRTSMPDSLAHDIRTWGTLLALLVVPAPLQPQEKKRPEVATLAVNVPKNTDLSSADEQRMRADVEAAKQGIASVVKAWPRDDRSRLAVQERAVLASSGVASDKPSEPRVCLVLKSADKHTKMPAFTVALDELAPVNVRDWSEARERWTLGPPRALTPAEQEQRALVAEGKVGAALAVAGIRVSYALRMLVQHGMDRDEHNAVKQYRAKDVLSVVAPWRLAEAARRGRTGLLAGSAGSPIVLRGATLDVYDARYKGDAVDLADSDWRDDVYWAFR